MKRKESVKIIIAIALLVVSLIFAAVSLLSPPRGVIDSTVLLFTGEALAMISCILGIDFIKSKNIVH